MAQKTKVENRAVARFHGEVAGSEGDADPLAVAVQLSRELGRAEAYRHVALSARAREVTVLLEVKEGKMYRRLGLTWEAFCAEFVGRPRQEVDEELATARVLGAQIAAVARVVGITRDDLRDLRTLPADTLPRMLSDGRIEIDGEAVPVETPADRELVQRRLIELLEAERADRKSADAGKEAADAARDEAAAKAKKLEAVIADGERDLLEMRETLNGVSLLRGELLARDASIPEVIHQLVQVNMHLVLVADRVENAHPDRDSVLRAARALHHTVDRLLRYGGDVDDSPAPAEDAGLDFTALEAARSALGEDED